MIIRIVDIGSNSVKASRYSVEAGRHRLIDREKLDYSLGEAVFPRGAIPDSGRAKIAAFIGSPGSKTGAKTQFTFALATSAVRSALNREDFVQRLSEETGVGVRVLTGAEESFLIHQGILSRAKPAPGEVIKTLDIGGGSAEVSWSRDGKYLFGRSYDLGAIRIARRFFDDKPYTSALLAQVYEHALSEFGKRSPAAAPVADRAIGSSGNVRAIGQMAAGIRGRLFQRNVHGVTPGTLEDLAEFAVGRTSASISEAFALQPARARIIMAGVMVMLASLRHFGIRRLEITEAGLREGAAAFWSRHGHLTLPVLEDHGSETEIAVGETRLKKKG